MNDSFRWWTLVATAVVVASLALLPTRAHADTTSTLCTNTSYVDGSSNKTRGTNYGSQPDLAIAGTLKYAYLECVVSGIPAGATVIGATLDAFSRSVNSAHTVRAHTVAAGWTESTLTWNNRPAFDPAILSSAPGDLVAGAGEWVNLTAPNVTGNGTWRYALDVSVSGTQFYASDDYTTDVTRRPKLTVTHSPAPPAAPVANFSGTPTSGPAPLSVQFADTSTGSPTSWAWDFGDGATSSIQNPAHSYSTAGTYTVSLTATNAGGSDGETKTGYITVAGPPPGWTVVLDDQFDVDGPVPGHWSLYDGPYGSDPFNCAVPSHDYVQGGSLHLLMSYEATTPPGGDCGAAWYTGGMQLGAAYASVDQRVTLRFRELLTDPLALNDPTQGVRSHKNVPMHFGDSQSPCWPAGGEIDYMEGTNPVTLSTFIHYGTTCSPGSTITGPNYSADFRNWHTVRVERANHTVKVWVDDLVTPVWTRVGDASIFPDVPQRLVLQQECRAAGCPPPSSYTADIQIDWITVENPT